MNAKSIGAVLIVCFGAMLSAQEPRPARAPENDKRAPSARIRLWIFGFTGQRDGDAFVDPVVIGNFDRSRRARKVKPNAARAPKAARNAQSSSNDVLERERYHAWVQEISIADDPDGADRPQSIYAGRSRLEYALRKEPDGRLIINLVSFGDEFRAPNADPRHVVTAEKNVVRVCRDDRPIRLRVPWTIEQGFIVFDIVGEDENAWNLEPFGDDSQNIRDSQLLRYLLLRYDENAETYAPILLELLRLMPATAEMPANEAQRLIADVREHCAKTMPADRLRIAVEQAAMMAGLDKAVPTESARWTETDTITTLDFTIYRDLAYYRRLARPIRAYALARTLAHSIDPHYNDMMLREIDNGAVLFDEAKAPKLLAGLRAESRNRNPRALVPLSAATLGAMIVCLWLGKKLSGRALLH